MNVGEDRDALISEIRMELASTAHHAFRFTQEGKLVPLQFADAIREVQQGYKPSHHEDLGESPNAKLMQDPGLLAYMVVASLCWARPKTASRKFSASVRPVFIRFYLRDLSTIARS